MHHVKPPTLFADCPRPWVFLAGSIEMGKAGRWQDDVVGALEDTGFCGTIINPRRDDWDSSWKQEFTNPQFYQQVTWELAGLKSADTVLVYFDPETKAPITLLELGILTAKSDQVIVCCPEGFWRRGNVEVVCSSFGIQMVNTIDHLIDSILNS